MREANSRPDVDEAFRKLNPAIKEALASEESPLRLGLAALELAKSNLGAEQLTVNQLVAALDATGVALRERSLLRAFSRAGNKIASRTIQGEKYYKIMTSGSREVARLVSTGNLQLIYVEGGQPRAARKRLGELFANLQGLVRISDPYYGERSLDTLEMIPEISIVRFLTARTPEDPAKLKRMISDLRRERPQAEIRLYPSPKQLHDRYIHTDERLLLVGHGLKDIGEKESFVIALDRTISPDVLDDVRDAFDTRWSASSPI